MAFITTARGPSVHDLDADAPTSFQPITDSLLKIIFGYCARYRMDYAPRDASITAVNDRPCP
ncbi:hypothetical protein [Mycolicibacter minnesotensis]